MLHLSTVGRLRLQTLCWKLQPVLHTISARAGFSASPGCREVVTWRLEAFPPAWRGGTPAGGSPSPRALRQVAPGGGGKWEAGASQGSPRGRLRCLGRSRYRAAPCLRPQPSGRPAPNPPPGLEGQLHAETGLLRQRSPRADATLCGPLTRLRGPSITSIDPGVSGGLRKGSDGARAHGG